MTPRYRQIQLTAFFLDSFYEWRQPRRTAWTLVWLGLGCIAFYMTPVWLLVKITSLFAGLTFFGLFPIASRYPKYRLLASPIKWFFWDIPTHGMITSQVKFESEGLVDCC